MSLISIPVQSGNPTQGFSSNFKSTVLLEQRRYGLTFYTNTADGLWYFDLFDATNDVEVIAGLGLATGLDLLYPYRYLTTDFIPPGILFVNDQIMSETDPVLTSFENQEALLYYCTSDECTPFGV